MSRQDLSVTLSLTRDEAARGCVRDVLVQRWVKESAEELVKRPAHVSVQVPPGAGDRQLLRIAGAGHDDLDEPRGDLCVTCVVSNVGSRTGPRARSWVRPVGGLALAIAGAALMMIELHGVRSERGARYIHFHPKAIAAGMMCIGWGLLIAVTRVGLDDRLRGGRALLVAAVAVIILIASIVGAGWLTQWVLDAGYE